MTLLHYGLEEASFLVADFLFYCFMLIENLEMGRC